MEITLSPQQGRVPVMVFHIQGDIDADTFEQLETQARQSIQNGTRYLVLDPAQVGYISSYGIRGISQIYTWLRDAAKDESDAAVSQGVRDGSYKSPHLKLVNLTPAVQKVMVATGMDMFLEFHSDLTRAVASFDAGMNSLVIEAERKNLAVLRCFVAETTAALGVSGSPAEDLILAVDESATNIIVHGYNGQPGRIELQLGLDPAAGELVARLFDESPYFDPLQAGPPDLTLPLDQRYQGGLGIYLCRTFTDSLSYRRTPDGRNELTLRKKVNRAD